MSKRNILISVLVGLVALVAIFIFFTHPASQKIDVEHGGESKSVTVPQAVTKMLSDDTSQYSIRATYPELEGLASTAIQAKVNDSLKAEIYNQVAGFRSAQSAAPSSTIIDQNLKSSFAADFEIKLLTNSFLSVLISYSDYSTGAAHPNNYLTALNYDLKTGDQLFLDDFLRRLNPSMGYMARLGTYVQDDLVRQLGGDPDSVETIHAGAAPTAENYQDFTVEADGFTIHFNPYQVAAYAAGAPAVTLSFSQLQDLLSGSGPVSSTATASSTNWWWLN